MAGAVQHGTVTTNGDALALDQAVEALIAADALTNQDVERARRAAEAGRERVDHVLVKLGLVQEETLADALAAALGLERLPTTRLPDEPLLDEALPRVFIENSRVIPIAVLDTAIHLAMADPLNELAVRAVAHKCGRPVVRHVMTASEFEEAFRVLYRDDEPDGEPDGAIGTEAMVDRDLERLRELASDAPVIKLVNELIAKAADQNASDIHVEATRSGARVRVRVDGRLEEVRHLEPRLRAAVVSRVKIMGGLDIAETRLPQDGRLRVPHRGRSIDLRLSTMPHVNGEGAVLRLLDRSQVVLELDALGFTEPHRRTIRDLIRRPNGILLITGPTGSGKTTTLYAALRELVAPERNIVSVEDPVEYQLEGVNQIAVRADIGLTFARALRSILRQDPDVVVIGEIRDPETAAIAVQAALTGHLVLATLHTNSAVAAIPRLLDMGVEDYLLATTLSGVMAQRLVRAVCASCATPDPDASRAAVLADATCKPDDAAWRRGAGCDACRGTGFQGRLVIAEIVPSGQWLTEAIRDRADGAAIDERARQRGIGTLLTDGIGKAAAGHTTLEEVLGVVREH